MHFSAFLSSVLVQQSTNRAGHCTGGGVMGNEWQITSDIYKNPMEVKIASTLLSFDLAALTSVHLS
jgi:hypothetical protein